MIIHSSKIYMEDGCKSGYLEIEGGKIKRFIPEGIPAVGGGAVAGGKTAAGGGAVAGGSPVVTPDVDYGENRIIPGIFDTHNHGGYGIRVYDGDTEDDIKLYLKGSAANGVTALFPTTTELIAMQTLSKMADKPQDGAKIMGIHSEGPWGARVGEKGVNTGYPAVDLDHAKKMVDAGGGKLRLVGIAPEVDDAYKAIDYFLSQGITMAMYHTNANYEQANAAIDRGITVSTHLCNVMTGLHHRDVGVMGASILRGEVYCELICDGLHVSLPMIDIILKLKSHDKIMMISDNVSYAGMPVGTYRNSWRGEKSDDDNRSDRDAIHITEDGFVLSNTGRLSGSSKPVIFGMKNLVEKLGMPLEDVIRLSSYNPHYKYGTIGSKGSLKKGKDADFAVISDDFNVLYTYSEGRLVFDHKVDTNIVNQKFIDEFRVN